MVVATDVTAYQNPKKERPPFVPVEKKEVTPYNGPYSKCDIRLYTFLRIIFEGI